MLLSQLPSSAPISLENADELPDDETLPRRRLSGDFFYQEDAPLTDERRRRGRLRRPVGLSQTLINFVYAIDRCDVALVPACYHVIGQTFGASTSQLGSITFLRHVLQAICSPFSGQIADRYDRGRVLGFSCIMWGVATLGMSSALGYWQLLTWRAFNGIALSLAAPTGPPCC